MSDTKDIHSNEGDIFMYLTLPTYNSFKYLKTIYKMAKENWDIECKVVLEMKPSGIAKSENVLNY